MRTAIAILLALAGIVLIAAGLFSWGVNNHVIGFPYREMVGIGIAFIGLAVWTVVA